MKSTYPQAGTSQDAAGHLTRGEILQQPELWGTTLERVGRSGLSPLVTKPRASILTGAGTSAYAAAAVAASWPNARAIPTTDLLVASRDEIIRASPRFADEGLLVSLARSGQSPESTAVVAKLQKLFPSAEHLVISCNADGDLARMEGVHSLVLDPRTNDRSLAMTSSFSNLVLAGLSLCHSGQLSAALPRISADVRQQLSELDRVAASLAAGLPARVAVLTCAELAPLADEIALKVLEMTAGSVCALPQTFLGLRHGPMSFLRSDSVVLCLLSTDHGRRRYEEDLIGELRLKTLGRLVIIGPESANLSDAEARVGAAALELPDYLRAPFEAPFGQLLAYHLSLRYGLDPDNPSPNGVITRVVQGFRIHDEDANV